MSLPTRPDTLIAQLHDPLVRDLARRGTPVSFPARAIVVHEDERADTVYVVLGGRLKVYVSDAEGRSMVIGECAPGDLLGELSLDGGPRSASAMALVPSMCARLARQDLREAVQRDPEVAFRLLACAIERGRAAIATARRLALLDGPERVMDTLLRLARPDADGRLRVPPMTREELAERAGVSRDHVHRIVRELRQRGRLVLARDRGIEILPYA